MPLTSVKTATLAAMPRAKHADGEARRKLLADERPPRSTNVGGDHDGLPVPERTNTAALPAPTSGLVNNRVRDVDSGAGPDTCACPPARRPCLVERVQKHRRHLVAVPLGEAPRQQREEPSIDAFREPGAGGGHDAAPVRGLMRARATRTRAARRSVSAVNTRRPAALRQKMRRFSLSWGRSSGSSTSSIQPVSCSSSSEPSTGCRPQPHLAATEHIDIARDGQAVTLAGRQGEQNEVQARLQAGIVVSAEAHGDVIYVYIIRVKKCRSADDEVEPMGSPPLSWAGVQHPGPLRVAVGSVRSVPPFCVAALDKHLRRAQHPRHLGHRRRAA